MRPILFVGVFFLFLSNILFAQDYALVSKYLDKSNEFYLDKKYEDAISEAEKGIVLYEGFEKDSIYTVLLENQYLSWHRLNNDTKAMSICRKAVEIYTALNKFDRQFAHHCRAFCSMGTAYNSTHTERHDCVMNIFRTGYFRYNDYFLYEDSFFSHNVRFKDEDALVLEEISKDEEIIKALNFKYLYPFYLYLKADYSPFNQSVPLLNRAIDLMKVYDKEEPRDNFLYYFHRLLYDDYLENGMAASAAMHYKSMLDLLSDNWEEWHRVSPWHPRENYIEGHAMKGFELYTDCLEKAKLYNDIIDYCGIVLKDKRLDNLHISFRKYVLETLRNAYRNTNDEQAVQETNKAIDEIISTMKQDEELDEDNKADYYCSLAYEYWQNGNKVEAINSIKLAMDNGWENNYPHPMRADTYNILFEILLSFKEYDLLTQYAKGIINAFEKEFTNENNEIEIYYDYDAEAVAKMSEHDIIIGNYREQYHHMNGIGNVWLSYYYLGIVAHSQRNYSDAIKYQRTCLDIVRTDWWADPDERASIFSDPQGYAVKSYIGPEINMQILLGKYYLDEDNYESAFNLLQETINLITETVLIRTSFGSDIIKKQEWESWEKNYIEIEKIIIKYSSKYPHFNNLLFQISSVRNGFLLNNHLLTHHPKDSLNAETKKLIDKVTSLEAHLESSYYVPSEDSKQILEQLEFNQGMLYDRLSQTKRSDILSTTSDCLLPHNASLAVLFSLEEEGSFSYMNLAAQIDNGEMIERTIRLNHLYALVIRNGWSFPKLIDLGTIEDLIIKNEEPDYYTYFVSHTKTSVNSIYTSTVTYNLLCKPLIDAAELKEGEQLWYIPADIINELAIENIITEDGQTYMYQKYGIRRFSNIKHINENSKKWSIEDKVLAFEGTNSLYGTYDEINYLNELLEGHASIVSGDNGSEMRFRTIPNSTPNLLHIGTHGFNYITSQQVLSDNDESERMIYYLLGNRDQENLSVDDKAMFLTGLKTYTKTINSTLPTDGFLTAKEISMIDLTGCNMAVLSACSTGLGSISPEGVYGLQRGLKMAGVETLLISLWDVDDMSTTILMKAFYKQLFNGHTAEEALSYAKDIVRDYEIDGVDEFGNVILSDETRIYKDPFYWAGFVLID